MKFAFALLLLLGLGLPGSVVALDLAWDQTGGLHPGLVVTEYPRLASQANDENRFEVALDQLGEPIGERYLIESLAPWQWETERNAVARGFLEIEVSGDYSFTTRSFYDRNVLLIDGKVVCACGDGDDTVVTIPLKQGRVRIESVGFAASRGSSGITVRWKPPGQAELSPIPARLLTHGGYPNLMASIWGSRRVIRRGDPELSKPLANHLISVADDFVVEVYKNGVRIPDGQRQLLEEIFGATVERVNVDVRPGDWLVFHVVNNHLRWGGAKYFAVAGCLGLNDFGFVSAPGAEAWSVCDDPSRVREFISRRDEGTEVRAGAIAMPWADGEEQMRRHAGAGFPGKPLWGGAASTWIKFVASQDLPKPEALPSNEIVRAADSHEGKDPEPAPLASLRPTRWPVQILSAIYGTGGKDADVTRAVKELVEIKRAKFTVSPPSLGADPNPGWNKSLWILYLKDGVRREQRRNENESVLPENFYGPQDAVELAQWLPASRWRSEHGEWQFHADRSVTGVGIEGTPLWETIDNGKFRITWSAERKMEYQFDGIWGSFHEAENAAVVFHLMQ